MPTDVTTWTLTDAQGALDEEIKATHGTKADYEANRDYAETGDHWQKGRQWIGPTGTAATASAVLEKVKRQHTPSDVIGEVCTNVKNGLLGREADLSFAPLVPTGEDGQPSEDQAERAAAILGEFSAWWDRVKLWELAGECARRAPWAGRAPMRIWIPPGYRVASRARDEGGNEVTVATLPAGLSLAQALARIEVAAPAPDTAFRYTEPDTRREASVFFYADADGTKRAEIAYLEAARATAAPNAAPATRVKILTDDANAEPEEYVLQLGGRLPVVEMRTRLLITEPVRKQQARLNFFESLLNRVGESAGFPERYVANAKPSGIWMDAAPADAPALDKYVDENGKSWYLHPAPRTLGAAITTELVGLDERRADGSVGYASPTVVKFDPTDPEYAITACRYARETILRACHQAHLIEGESAATSGESKRQSRASFEHDLKARKPALEGLIRETIETVLAHAALMSPEAAEALRDFRVVVNLKVDAGPVSVEEQREAREQRAAGLLSDESAMAMAGVEDVAAERARIAASPLAVAALWKARGEALAALTGAGATLEGACRVLGVDDADVEALTTFGAATVEQ